MAEINVPDLCGGSVEIAAIQKEFEALIKSGLDGLEVDASTLSTTIGADVRAVTAELRKAIAEKPTLPNINLQSQLTSLSRLPPGSFAYVALLAAITLKFGDALKAGGYSIDDLVKVALAALVAGTDLCTEVPNFEVPAAGGEAIEKAVESKQPAKDSEEEEPSTIVENLPWLEEQKENETRVEDMQVEESEEIDVVGGTVTSEEPPTEDKGAFTVTEEKEEVVYGAQKTAVTAPDKQEGKNISTSGFSKRPVLIVEEFKLSRGITKSGKEFAMLPGDGEVDKDGVDIQKITLMRKPSRILSVLGYDSDYVRPATGKIKSISIKPVGFTAGRKLDTYTVSGKDVSIRDQYYSYDGNEKDVVYKIKYEYFDNYDPTWTVDE